MHACTAFRKIVLLSTLAGLSCYSDDCSPVEPAPVGQVEVTIRTTGGQPDSDGYQVDLEGTRKPAAVNDKIEFFGVTVGSREVRLLDLASNCGMPWLPYDPPRRLVTVPPGDAVAANFDVECPILASLDVTITGLPPGVPASVRVSSLSTLYSHATDVVLTQSRTLTGLWPIGYDIEASAVTAGGIRYTPDPRFGNVTVAEGETGHAVIRYSAGTGTLVLVVAGLPAGIDADITITGPAGFSAKPTSGTQFSPVEAGEYVIVAAGITAGGVTYVPDPATQTVTVPDGQTATATVTYQASSRPPIVLQDDFSVGSQWQETVAGSAGGATSTVETLTSGGVSGGYRHMTHIFQGPGTISVHHVYTGGSYDPRVLGAIETINYGEWRIEFNPPFSGAAIGSRFLVIQNGVTYTAPISGSSAFSNLTWEKGEALQLKPGDFTPAGLDFSSQGAEMFFGYLRSNTTTSASAYTTTHGIDDWRVEIVRVQN